MPAADQARNGARRIPDTPAGTEISVRTAGTRRPSSTAAGPWRRNQSSARSTSPGVSVSQRPWRADQRLSRASPSARPAKYHSERPASEPAVPASTTSTRLSSPRAAVKPASGMISSDGIGGNTFSANISSATPR